MQIQCLPHHNIKSLFNVTWQFGPIFHMEEKSARENSQDDFAKEGKPTIFLTQTKLIAKLE